MQKTLLMVMMIMTPHNIKQGDDRIGSSNNVIFCPPADYFGTTTK